MHYSWPRRGFTQAVFTHVVISVKDSIWTKQAIIMQSLHYRHPGLGAGVIGGWGNKGEEVMEMNYVWMLTPNEMPQLCARLVRPNDLPGQTGLTQNWESLDFGIMASKSNDLITCST